MKFTRGYAPEVQQNLIQARFETLGSMVEMANKQGCDLFVIAGDLFNNPTLPQKDILLTAELLRSFEGKLVVVLPGNHDYIQKGEDDLWTRFHQNMSEHTLLLEEPEPYDLRKYYLDMILYAAPCAAKHSSANAIGWIRKCPKDPEVKFHVGVAHGSLEGLSPDFNKEYYPMTEQELRTTGLDLWLMGHTHIRFPKEQIGTGARIFFPSTPEPDGFDCGHPGHAWLIEVGNDKSVKYEALQTGKYRFDTVEKQLAGGADVQKLKDQFERFQKERHLAKLKIKGRVPGEIYDQRSELLRDLEKCVLHLEVDLSELYREITAEDIDREFTEGSFPHRFLMTLAKDQDNPLSLQIAYDFIREGKS